MFRVRANGSGLGDAVAPYGSQLAGVAVAGFGETTRDAVRTLSDLGASRICAPGRLQAPPLAWRREGLPVLGSLARVTHDELQAPA